jgi:hypothetical protein
MVFLLEIEDNVTENHHQHQYYGKSSNSSNSDLTDNEQFRINPVEGGSPFGAAAPLPILLKASLKATIRSHQFSDMFKNFD